LVKFISMSFLLRAIEGIETFTRGTRTAASRSNPGRGDGYASPSVVGLDPITVRTHGKPSVAGR
jgi:hypothetical protein